MPRRLYAHVRETITEFNLENGPLLAAAIAYNLLFSLFPFVLVLVSVAGYLVESPVIQSQIVGAVGNLLPVSRQVIKGTIEHVVSARAASSVVAVLLLVVSSASFFNAVRKSLNAVWGIHAPQPLLKGQAVNIFMMLGTVLILYVSALASTGLGVISGFELQLGDLMVLRSRLLMSVAATAFGVGMAFVVVGSLYRFVPLVRPSWRHVWPGALVTAICFEAASLGFEWYVRIFDPYHVVYGSIGALIAFLMWVYISAFIFLFVAKFTAMRLRPAEQPRDEPG